MSLLRVAAACAVAGSLLAGPAARAELISGTGMGSLGRVSNAANTRMLDANGTANSQLQWGSTANTNNSFVNPSTLTAMGGTFGGGAPADDVVIGRIDWYNSTTRVNRMPGAINLDWTLSLGFPESLGAPGVSQTFALSIKNTTRSGSDAGTADQIKGFALDDLLGLAQALGRVTLSDLRYTLGAGQAGSSLVRDGDEWIWSNNEGNTASLVITADIALRPPVVVVPPGTLPPGALPPGGPNATAVPEPAALGMFALGMLGLGLMRWRRHVA